MSAFECYENMMRALVSWLFSKKTPEEKDPKNGIEVKFTSTSQKYEHLTPQECEIMNNYICPDCRNRSLIEGPSGGCSTNIYCNFISCGSKFNAMGPFGVERISDASPLRIDNSQVSSE